MKALVTGANGLIGANLLRSLHRQGHQANGLVRTGSDLTHIAHLPVTLSVGDVLNMDSLREPMSGRDVVFHTAVHFSYWGHDHAEVRATALDGTRNVLTAARGAGVRRVVVTSSTVTLGAGREPLVRDETSFADADDSRNAGYVATKIEQEARAAQIAEETGIEIVFALPTMSVGPFGTSLGPSNGVITSYLADSYRLSWPGGCNIVAVEDVADGHILLAESGEPGARYVLGSENLTWREVHGMIAELSGVSPPLQIVGKFASRGIAAAQELRALVTGSAPLATRKQADMVGRYYWYSHAATQALGYSPRSARDALAGAIAWLAASPHVARETRMGMRLDRKVHEARAGRVRAEDALRNRAA
ncbi:NAD-dependent epimerase/dehydratase family protein [Aurantiacibacter poecillastricola]|uniref:NAD-dependent epimerase/dehydratase family protein n=1 Tax=Aurantiacibacter poecillastricola TaxID=3064385 RepID=UPI00273ED365|nr:NAD-dependent epimerase/dehydratase family protein [Aurantiacibacter sp. 219JJ12-13]MDP5261562.1 NAD-dependent epimerase/dehydratase family protein [Aurantiacibacter sp. 219JJ12-13]